MAWIRWRTDSRGRRTAQLLWRDESGRTRSRALGSISPATASMHVRMAEVHLEGKSAPQSPTTAPDALAAFLEHLRVEGRRPGTIRYYAEKLSGIVSAWSGTPMDRWTRPMLTAYLAAQDWSPRRAQMTVGALRRWARWARDAGVLLPDVTEGLRTPKVRQPRREALTLDQVRAVIDQAGAPWLELAVGLSSYAGLSWADVRGLDWTEVGRDVLVRQRSKTGQPLRIPITAPLAALLEPHRRRSGPVVAIPADDRNAYRALHRACSRAGLPPAARGCGGWHRFRHTYATLLDQAGASLPTVQALMGHRPGSPVTLRYVHAPESKLREALDRALGGD